MTKPILAVGFDRAFVGIAQRCGQPDLAVYDYDAAVAILVKEAGMPINEAVDFLEEGELGAWHGDSSPLWLTKMPLAAALESWAFEE